MANFIPTKKTNPCPACGDTKGKCRTFSDSPQVLCMESAGGTQRVGWINQGDTKDRLWAKLIPDDEQARGKSWQEQQEERARKIEREKAIEREKLKHALPIEDRSPEFRKFLLQLEIKPEDNQDLINRGLSPEDIKQLLIKSVEPLQEVKEIKPNLPGIYNNQISVAGPGYLCPAYDEFGRIVGCQIRIRDAEDNKYRWLKGKFSSHLLVNGNKELPLTVLKGEGKDAYLCEGILKPAIANIVHNKTFIGASGGNFSGSPEQLKRILKSVAKDGIVYFCPDGGFNANPQVQRRDRATVKLIQSLGYEVYILDWGQLSDKMAGDVDEISFDVLESAKLITATDFLKTEGEKLREAAEKAQAEKEERDAGGKPISKEEWLALKAEEWWEWLKGRANSFKDAFNFSRGKFQKFVDDNVKFLRYGVDPLPTPDCEIKLPKIRFPKSSDRVPLALDLIALGWKNILDLSAPGSGKSHGFNSLYKGEDLDEEGKPKSKTWYLHGDHRNPTVAPAERKDDLPSRHNGLIEDKSRTTPLGQPFLRRWQWSEETPEPDIPSNCPETDRFNNLSTKGYDIHAKTEEGKQNPICAQCPILHECISSGYKAQRKETMESSYVRAHPDSLPSPEEYNYEFDIALWEETSTLLKPVETRSLFKKDLDQQWEWLEREAPEAYDRLRPIKHKLNDILSGKIDLPRFGANTSPDAEGNADLRSLLGIEDYPLLEADLLLLKSISDRAQILDKSDFEQADHVSFSGFSEEEKRKWKGVQQTVNSKFRGQARNENRDANEALPTLGLYELILLLFENSEAVAKHREQVNNVFGYVSVNHGEVKLTLNNSRHWDIASRMGVNVFLDATIQPKILAGKLRIKDSELITIEQEPPSYSNLIVHGIKIDGMKSKDHSDDCNRRKKALLETIVSDYVKDELFATISFKNDDEIEHEGYWFNDSRSTNKFKGTPHLIAFGTPYQHYGDVKAEYYTVFGTLEGFDEYYKHLKEAEIIQLIGRQRSQLYPDQEFNIYLIGTDLDLTFLEEMGIDVRTSHGLEWTSEAGTHSQANKFSLIWHALNLGEKFWKLTQTELAKTLGVTQGRISQILKEIGGKAKLRKILMSLYESYIGRLINPLALLNIKDIQQWLTLEDDDLALMGLNTVIGYMEAMAAFIKSGRPFEEFEDEYQIPIFLVAAIALGASPPPE